ncbi:hypothetical protein BDV93DRAFT_552953 [Ceratobasidium sp. AG-I]|nr:hypothetical protein BDV93DRAFT_552953 [Ceratobasidium sp. AG-I]
MARLNQSTVQGSPVNQLRVLSSTVFSALADRFAIAICSPLPLPFPLAPPTLIQIVIIGHPPIPLNPHPPQAVIVFDEPQPAVGAPAAGHTSLLNSLYGNPHVDNAIQEGGHT